MSKMKEQLEIVFVDPTEIGDLRKRIRFMIWTMIRDTYPTTSKTRSSLVRAYNSLSSCQGGLITTVMIGKNMLKADGETWAYHAWKRVVKDFLNTLETPELKKEARQVLGGLANK